MKIKKINTPLFDSRQSSFKLYTETVLTKYKDSKDVDLHYFSQKYGVLYSNTDVYLVFEYRHPESYQKNEQIYLSYSHMYTIKNMFESLKNIIEDNTGKYWIESDGVLYFNETDNQDDYVFSIKDIGRNSQWISFRPAVIETNYNGVQDTERGLQISYSNTEQNDTTSKFSILNIKEFLNVYQIIKDLNLLDIQLHNTTLGFLTNNSQQQPVYQQPQQPVYQQPQQYQTYQQPGYQQQPQQYQTYQQNNYSRPQQAYTRAASPTQGYVKPTQHRQPQQQQTTTHTMQPREDVKTMPKTINNSSDEIGNIMNQVTDEAMTADDAIFEKLINNK